MTPCLFNTMHKLTVRELIEELQRQDPDAIITTPSEDGMGMFIRDVERVNDGNLSREVRITFTQE